MAALKPLLKEQAITAFNANYIKSLLFGSGEAGVLYVPVPQFDGQTLLFQDDAGTTPVTADGDPVGLMLDLSPNGNDASQSTSAARPLYRTDGTLHWLEFDGVDDKLSALGVLGGASLADMAILAAYQTADTVATERMYGFGSFAVDGSSGTIHLNPAPDPSLRFDGASISTGYSQPHPSTSFVRSTTKDGTSYSERFNSVEVLPATAQADNGIVDDFYMGHVHEPIAGKLYGLISVDTVLAIKHLNNSEQYLANLAGITL